MLRAKDDRCLAIDSIFTHFYLFTERSSRVFQFFSNVHVVFCGSYRPAVCGYLSQYRASSCTHRAAKGNDNKSTTTTVVSPWLRLQRTAADAEGTHRSTVTSRSALRDFWKTGVNPVKISYWNAVVFPDFSQFRVWLRPCKQRGEHLCSGHVLAVSGRVLAMFWPNMLTPTGHSGHVLAMFWPWSGHVLAMCWPCSGHVLVVFWLFWPWSGHDLAMFWPWPMMHFAKTYPWPKLHVRIRAHARPPMASGGAKT